jgi:hypothetical protein
MLKKIAFIPCRTNLNNLTKLNLKLNQFIKFNFFNFAKNKNSQIRMRRIDGGTKKKEEAAYDNDDMQETEMHSMKQTEFKKFTDFMLNREKYSWNDYLQQLIVNIFNDIVVYE